MDKNYFLKRAREVHGDKYTYEKVRDDIKNNKQKVIVTCPMHGDFEISIVNFLNGRSCPKCNHHNYIINKNKLYQQKFIEKSKQIHDGKYDYSKVEYVNAKTPVCIICPEHGEFWQTPDAHVRGEKCPKCAHRGYKYTTEEFIEKAMEVHAGKYDYSKLEYVNCRTKVCIICPKHGEFWQMPNDHLNGNGCPKCAHELIGHKKSKTKEEFINRLESKFGKFYDYSLLEFVNFHTKVKLIYNGRIIEATPSKFLSNDKPLKWDRVRSKDDFIVKAKQIHGNRYDYSKVEYINTVTKVCIICPEHGEFYQTPNEHLSGAGCRECKSSNLEKRIKQYLIDNDIKFETQYRPQFLSEKFSHQSLDFYLPDYNIAIECQGIQHFKNVAIFKNSENSKKRDIKKNIKCKENGINILYLLDRHICSKNVINNEEYNFIYKKENTFRDSKTSINELIDFIKNGNIKKNKNNLLWHKK